MLAVSRLLGVWLSARHCRVLGVIYFLRAGERIKIGFAKSEALVRSRFGAIRANSPVAVVLLGMVDGSLEDERALHVRFAEHRLLSGWFGAAPEILELAASARPVRTGPAHGTRLSFRCSHELVAAVDVARGETAREVWLRRAVERALELQSPAGEDRPVPAEQPVYAKPLIDHLTGLEFGAEPVEKALGSDDDAGVAAGLPSTRALPDQRSLAPSEPVRLRCRVAGCEFSAGSPLASCPRHGGRVR